MKWIICLWASLCLCTAYAQTNNNIKPLGIGDTLPAGLVLTNVLNYPASEIRLSDLKGKLVILDFWATWCSACIGGFPKLDRVQKKYAGKIQVLLINSKQTADNMQKITAAFERYRIKTGYSPILPYVVYDTALQTLFPHQSLPHLIWISPEGKYIASSYSEAVTSENIQSVLDQKEFSIHIKKDSLDFSDKGLLLSSSPQTEPLIAYRSIFTGYIEGVGFKTAQRMEETGHTKYRVLNFPLNYFYSVAFPNELGVPRSQMIFSPDLPSFFKEKFLNPTPYSDRYCFELYMPGLVNDDEAAKYLKEELTRTFKVSVKREKKITKVFSISATSSVQQYYTKGGFEEIKTTRADEKKYLRNTPIAVLFDILNDISAVPIINATAINKNVDISLPGNLYSYSTAQLLNWLKDIGFSIEEKKTLMDFSIFSPAVISAN